MTLADFWQGRRVFVTGHTGFKGSWLWIWLDALGAELTGYALAPPTTPSLYAEADLDRLGTSVIGDVRDTAAVAAAMTAADPEVVLHLAAQPLVRASYDDPVGTYATNVMGTVNVLEAARSCPNVRAIVNVTTDKCYENQEWPWGYREHEPMGGHDPYSSSKGASELVTSAYRRSFFTGEQTAALGSARAGNVIGGGDWALDRLVPDTLAAFTAGEPVVLRNPHATRPWQHVLEPLSGYLLLAERLWSDGQAVAEGWNFGPDDVDARPVDWVVGRLASTWGPGADWRVDAGPHPHEASFLKLDTSKARSRLDWAPRWHLARALSETVDWHRAWAAGEDALTLCRDQIATYTTTTWEEELHVSTRSAEELRGLIGDLVREFAEVAHTPGPFAPGESPVPVSGKVVGEQELLNMVDASLDGWLTTGRFNAEFEKQLAAFLGVQHVLSVNSGSSANLVAFSTLTSPKLGERAIKPGDEVIGVAAGFPTTVNPILQFGAVPVFVDVDLATHNIDSSKIEAAITPKTKAIMLAHSLGNPFDLATVRELCDKHGLWLIEDCCDALGSRYDGKLVGTFGDIATLSFYPAHHITMGEGGAVFTNNPQLKLIAESFRDWGRDCYCLPGKDNTCNKRFCWQLGTLPEGYDHKYIYSHAGYNLKITDMQAACGLAQLGRLDEFIAARKANFDYLHQRLQTLTDYLHLPVATPNSDPSWFGFPIVLDPDCGFNRVDLLSYLDENKIGTRLLFAGNITRQPYMIGRNYRVSGELTNTETVMHQTFWLGVYPGLTTEHLDYVAEKLEEFFGVGF